MGYNYLSIPKPQRLNRWSLGMYKYFHPIFHSECNYLSILRLKLNHVSKMGHGHGLMFDGTFLISRLADRIAMICLADTDRIGMCLSVVFTQEHKKYTQNKSICLNLIILNVLQWHKIPFVTFGLRPRDFMNRGPGSLNAYCSSQFAISQNLQEFISVWLTFVP